MKHEKEINPERIFAIREALFDKFKEMNVNHNEAIGCMVCGIASLLHKNVPSDEIKANIDLAVSLMEYFIDKLEEDNR